jgi:hypothetical protein
MQLHRFLLVSTTVLSLFLGGCSRQEGPRFTYADKVSKREVSASAKSNRCRRSQGFYGRCADERQRCLCVLRSTMSPLWPPVASVLAASQESQICVDSRGLDQCVQFVAGCSTVDLRQSIGAHERTRNITACRARHPTQRRALCHSCIHGLWALASSHSSSSGCCGTRARGAASWR